MTVRAAVDNQDLLGITGRLQAEDLIHDRELHGDEKEQDLLGHAAIANRVADLLLEAKLPINVAIFAPWGSGKSSFHHLVKDTLVRREADSVARLIRYDVWNTPVARCSATSSLMWRVSCA
jgi:predicted KAP-like P-loop ATPase